MRHHFTVIENEWIPLRDGSKIRLAARIWMPEGADRDPVPAVLEYLPYRKRDGTCSRDESCYPHFANARIAGVRVDIRGSGESDGIIDGEYTQRELSDACEVISWIADQPWCNGSVGMMGISWGGFNSLQVASLAPPALKAIISLCSSVDRYNDDIHYKGGCHLSAQLSWAATMLGYQSRPPDLHPDIVDSEAAWRSIWRRRLDGEPFFMKGWLAHQRRDGFWRHGSVCEDFSKIRVPTLLIAGWLDGYRCTPFKAIEGMGVSNDNNNNNNRNVKALIGPWVHKYPHFAWPKPRADFVSEAMAWWNHWLRDNIDHETEGQPVVELPQMRAYILDAVRPSMKREHDAGFWVAKEKWSALKTERFHVEETQFGCFLVQGAIPEDTRKNSEVFLRSALDTGTCSGEFFALSSTAGEIPMDQRVDDALSQVYESALLDTDRDYLGMPSVTFSIQCDTSTANICVRLVDVHPDGAATRVSFGVLNLAYRNSQADPEPMPAGKSTEIKVTLDACGYRFRKGHRIRLSFSTSYWPFILPPPSDPGVTIDVSSISLSLPLLGEHERIRVPEPRIANPLPEYIEHSPPASRRQFVRDLTANETKYTVFEDTGMYEHPDTGLSTRQVRDEVWTIGLDDPLSMTGVSTWTCEMQRKIPQQWNIKTVATSRMSCTATDWIISAKLEAYEGSDRVFKKTFEETKIPRDFM